MDYSEDHEETDLDLDFLPPTLKKLKKFSDLLDDTGVSFDDNFGLGWTDSRVVYHQTPLDVLPFMSPGVDGIHVGLLTDFGKVTDLEQAFVVCVSPMEEPENAVKLLARNPKEFIDYLVSDKYLLILCNAPVIESKSQYQRFLDEAEDEDETDPKQHELKLKLRSFMDSQNIDDVHDYVQITVPAERNVQIALPTLDGLGIVNFSEANRVQEHTFIEASENMALGEVSTYFEGASEESKLAFVRNAQFSGVIFEDLELKAFLVRELKKMGCNQEAKRLESYDW